MRIPFLHKSHSEPLFVVRLTIEQWREVAERSASDYHDWMDAIEARPFTAADRQFKELEVDAKHAVWIAGLFGIEVVT